MFICNLPFLPRLWRNLHFLFHLILPLASVFKEAVTTLTC